MPDRSPMASHRASAGFLMVEALIALAIVAIMAGVVFETVWQMGGAAARSGDQRAALLLARSVLAASTVDSPVAPIAARGRDGALSWAVSIQNWNGENDGGLTLREVRVTITDARSGVVLARLDGMKGSS